MKKILKRISAIFFTCCYVVCVGLLVWQALTPGKESSNISTNFGDAINSALTEIFQPVTQTVDVSSVNIENILIDDEKQEPEQDNNSYNYVEIGLGSIVEIGSKVLPSNATNPSVEYSVENDCLTVEGNGVFSADKVGECLVVVTSSANNQLKDELLVKIVEINAESIKISNPKETLYLGQTYTAKVAFNPSKTSDKSVVWSVSDESVLSVNKKGKIKALSVGTATVTAKWSKNQDISVSFDITVEELPVIEDVELIDISCKASSIELKRNDKYDVTVEYNPSNSTYKGINWESSDESIATVDSSGRISAINAGSCVITGSSDTYSDKKVQINVVVKERLSSVINLSTKGLDNDNVIKIGSSATIKASLDKSATVKSIYYESSNENVATVSQDGVISAVAEGTAIITVYSAYDDQRVESKIELTVQKVSLKDTISNFYYWIRKTFGHFGAFLVLGAVASLMFLSYSKKGILSKVIVFAICMVSGFAVAGLTEILQLPIFTVGRYCSFTDVMIDFSGFSVSSIAVFIIVFIYEALKIIIPKIIKKHQNNK